MLNSPFKIKEINMSSTWVYNVPKNNDCTICRCNLNTPSLYNQEKGLDSFVVSGTCLHSFHQECIKPWVKNNSWCPICSSVWQYKINVEHNDKYVFQKKIISPYANMPPLIKIDGYENKEEILKNINNIAQKYNEEINVPYLKQGTLINSSELKKVEDNFLNNMEENNLSSTSASSTSSNNKAQKIISIFQKETIDNIIEKSYQNIIKNDKTEKKIIIKSKKIFSKDNDKKDIEF